MTAWMKTPGRPPAFATLPAMSRNSRRFRFEPVEAVKRRRSWLPRMSRKNTKLFYKLHRERAQRKRHAHESGSAGSVFQEEYLEAYVGRAALHGSRKAIRIDLSIAKPNLLGTCKLDADLIGRPQEN